METVNPSVPSTIEAAALCKMADRGQITGGILDGPLALDNAISLEAAQIKEIKSPVAGRANVLVVPDLEAGNMLAKSLTFLANADSAGIVLGAQVPIILTSRADSVIARLASCAVACAGRGGATRGCLQGDRMILLFASKVEQSEGGAMTDAILVLNAGSSSIKFSLFAAAGVEPAVVTRGQIEGIDTSPHFIAKDAAGQTASEQRWAQGTKLGHDGAVAHLVDWLKATYGSPASAGRRRTPRGARRRRLLGSRFA